MRVSQATILPLQCADPETDRKTGEARLDSAAARYFTINTNHFTRRTSELARVVDMAVSPLKLSAVLWPSEVEDVETIDRTRKLPSEPTDAYSNHCRQTVPTRANTRTRSIHSLLTITSPKSD